MSKDIAVLYIDLDAKVTRLQKSLDEATGVVRRSSRQMQREMREARGSIMLLSEELGVHLPRHLRNFVAELPGVSTLMASAFTGVAVFGLGKLVAEGAVKLYQMGKAAREAGEKTRDAFSAMNQAAQGSNDELRVTNDRLENEIAKLEHKPANNLKLALHESWVEADKFLKTTEEATKSVLELLKANSVGVFGALYHGSALTGNDANMINGVFAEIQKQQQLNSKRIHDASANDKDAIAAKNSADMHAKLAWAINKLNGELDKRDRHILESGKIEPRDMSANINMLQGALNRATMLRDTNELMEQNASDSAKRDALSGKGAKEKSALRDYEDYLNQYTLLHDLSKREELDYWQTILGITSPSAAEYGEIVQKAATFAKEIRAEWARAMGDMVSPLGWVQQMHDAFRGTLAANVAPEIAKMAKEYGILDEKQVKNLADYAKEKAELNTVAANYLEQNGAISDAAATRYKLAIATAEWAKQEKLLKDELSSAQMMADTHLGDQKYLDEVERIKDELHKLGFEHTKTVMDLNQQLYTTGWASAFDPLLRAAQNTSLALKQIFQTSINDINNELARMMTGQKTDWRKMGQGLLGDVSKVFLQKGEGELLKAFGLGGQKGPTGKAGDPIHTVTDGVPGASGVSSSAAGGLLGILNNSDFFGKLFGGHLFGPGSLFGGFMADGGDLSANKFYIAGEAGPEIVSGVNGRVFNSASTAQILSGSGAMYYVDARGSSAAEVEQRVARMLQAVHGSAVKTSLQVQQEFAKRRPMMAG